MLESTPTGGRVTTVDTFIRAAASVEAVDPASAILPGTVLEGCYEVRERLGTGGMATVYRAYDRRLEREVAIKVPRLGRGPRARVLAMFEREARATARLSHPNIVELHHVGHHHGTPFAVIALLSGETLAARLARRGVLAPDETLAIFDGVLQGLAHAHERGIVHRDLKPQNVFLTADDRVKLLDFGVAIEHGRAFGTATRAAGTPGYMAPEHAEAPDPRNDLWAAGVLFLECVTGRRGERGGAARTGAAPDGAAPENPRSADTAPALEIPAELPPGVRAAIARSIDPDPDRRPSTAGELRFLLASSLAPQPGRAGTSTARPLAGGRARRARWQHPRWIAAAALACVALVWLGLASGRGAPGPVVPRDGRWRGDPAAGTPWETELQRIDETRFAYKNTNRLTGHGLAGTLVLEQLSDGSTMLSGTWADLPTCPTCTNVGFIEFIVLDPAHLYQNRGAFGPSHDNYKESWPPYRYKWEGALRDTARL